MLVVVGLVVLHWWRSPGQRLHRASDDLADLAGVSAASSQSDDAAIEVNLTGDVTLAQSRAVLARATQIVHEPYADNVRVVAGSALALVTVGEYGSGPSSDDSIRTVSDYLVALNGLTSARVYVERNSSVALDTYDSSKVQALDAVREALGRIERAGLDTPDSLRTQGHHFDFDEVRTSPGQVSAVLDDIRPLVARDWTMLSFDDDELILNSPTGTTKTQVRVALRELRAKLMVVREQGVPVLCRVLVLDFDGVAGSIKMS